ncbi:acyltransferase [Mangrovitalea sediminis]|uniref:acyltransferase n=1 Tax=Mangrovitalea sediminis TaxID=1982043 RepID=UPI000BE4D07D|nr:acyltransferase [Mangrovitalea sediminis]
MLDFLPAPLKGVFAIALILMSTLFWYPPLLLLSILKLVIPLRSSRRLCTRLLIGIANIWITSNGLFLALLHRTEWIIEGREGLSQRDWYLVTCNHQSWADIPAIQFALNGRIPLLKFFLKRELIWVPLLGIAWWALDFPFMKRYPKELLEKRPELKGKDLETTRRACEKFKYTPVTVFNFLEGTRFTQAKHDRQQSPYQNLLRPKAGGVGFVLGAMGEQLHTLLDISILYPDGITGFWAFLCGRIRRIVIDIRKLPIPETFLGKDYVNDEAFRYEFQQWVGKLWEDKDQRLTQLRARFPAAV